MRRRIAVLLAAVMVLGLFSMVAYAAESSERATITQQEAVIAIREAFNKWDTFLSPRQAAEGMIGVTGWAVPTFEEAEEWALGVGMIDERMSESALSEPLTEGGARDFMSRLARHFRVGLVFTTDVRDNEISEDDFYRLLEGIMPVIYEGIWLGQDDRQAFLERGESDQDLLTLGEALNWLYVSVSMISLNIESMRGYDAGLIIDHPGLDYWQGDNFGEAETVRWARENGITERDAENLSLLEYVTELEALRMLVRAADYAKAVGLSFYSVPGFWSPNYAYVAYANGIFFADYGGDDRMGADDFGILLDATMGLISDRLYDSIDDVTRIEAISEIHKRINPDQDAAPEAIAGWAVDNGLVPALADAGELEAVLTLGEMETMLVWAASLCGIAEVQFDEIASRKDFYDSLNMLFDIVRYLGSVTKIYGFYKTDTGNTVSVLFFYRALIIR